MANSKMVGTRFQCLIVCLIVIVALYYILDAHIASMLDDPSATLIQSAALQSYVVGCDDNKNNNSDQHNPHQLYFANELALHTELIGYSYANQLEIRQSNFKKEMESFTAIGRDLLDGNINQFKHISRYYVHPSKYHEYTREYMLHKWINEHKNHINPTELIGAHPACPKWDKNNAITTYEIHFSHNCCKKYGPAHRLTAKETGNFDYVFHYQYENISAAFQAKNEAIMSYWRGAGYWLWKPWMILNTMLNIGTQCDIICYCDTGSWWNNTAIPLFELASKIKYGVMMFSHSVSHWGESKNSINLTERFWSKRDAFLLLGVDIDDIYDTVMRKATFSCYQTNPDSIHFVSEWLYHAMDKRIISDDEGTFDVNDLSHFDENRHDQSIMSLLSKKYGIPAFMDVSQYGYQDARKYGREYVLNWPFPWIVKHTRGKQ